MRVSERQIFDLANTRIMQARADSVQAGNRVASGKRIEHPWDGAGDAGMITQHAQERARQEGIFGATSRASEELVAADGAFDQLTSTLTRANELAVQLANDTYSASDRANAAAEVQQLFSAAVSQLNIRYGDRYLFGGMLDGAPPFDATGAYVGDANVRLVEIAPGIMQEASVRADEAFKGSAGGIDILQTLTDFSTALGANNLVGVRAAVQNLSDGIAQVSVHRSRAGAMMNVFDVAANTARLNRDGAADGQSKLEDVDIFEAASNYAAAERALEASMSAASRQFRLSLLDKL
jgi:flagellar hook-associated protein 3 FlgL